MKKLAVFVGLLLVFVSFSLMAQNKKSGLDGVNMPENFKMPKGVDVSTLIKGMNVDKKQILQMIDQLIKSGMLTKEDGVKAKKTISGLSDKEINQMKNHAAKKLPKDFDANKFLEEQKKKTAAKKGKK